MQKDERWAAAIRIGGLRRFAASITLLNLLGHTVLGFEQSWAQPVIALLAAYATELGIETVDAAANRRRPAFAGGPGKLADFLLSAHIAALATSMLLYANDRLWVVAFASSAAVASKAIFRVPVKGRPRHFFNPSNFGIVLTLLLFRWVGIAPPYQFTENLVGGPGVWILPAVVVVTGTLINARFSGRLPLVAAWMGGFAAQALIRSAVFGTPVVAPLIPMTGFAFILFSFYMITDPATSPSDPKRQVGFGLAVAATYGLLVAWHVVFGLFFSLALVCLARGVSLYVSARRGRRRVGLETAPQPRAEVKVPAVAAVER